jgi:hypothetical protein
MGSSRLTKLASIVAMVGLTTALFAAVGGAAGAGEEKRGNVNGSLELGQLAAQTGPLSNIVQSLTVPVTMAVDEINADGGVLGKPVTYTVADDGTDPNLASESLEGLLEDSKVDAIMGPTSSGVTLNILERSAGEGAPLLGIEYVGGAVDDRLGRLLLPHHPVRPPAGAGAGRARPQGRPQEGRDPRPPGHIRRGLGDLGEEGARQGRTQVVADVSYDPDGDQIRP